MFDCLLTILVNQICRLFSTTHTPDSIITRDNSMIGLRLRRVISTRSVDRADIEAYSIVTSDPVVVIKDLK
jgi:hypothetical protein